MEGLFSSLFVMGLGSPVVDIDNFDIVGQLPNEIGSMILRYLDGDSLLKAATVSKRWNSLCRGDKKLRQRGRRHLRKMNKQRKEQIYGGLNKLSFVPVNEVTAFQKKNVQSTNRNIPLIRRNDEPSMIILHPNENILREVAVNVRCNPVRIQKPKSLTSQQKRRLLRH